MVVNPIDLMDNADNYFELKDALQELLGRDVDPLEEKAIRILFAAEYQSYKTIDLWMKESSCFRHVQKRYLNMKIIYYVLIGLLTLMVGCGEKKVTSAKVQPVSVWSDDSLVMSYQFRTWVQKFTAMTEQQRLCVAGKLITDESGHPERQQRLFALAEEYFHDPNSPYRNEDLYIPILEAFIADSLLKEGEKERPRYQLERARMNRPGNLATDFFFLTVSGKRMQMHEVESEYTLLYFFNPDCHDCGRVTHYLLSSNVFSDLQSRGLLKILAIYPDEGLDVWEKYRCQMPATWITGRYASEEDRRAFDLPAIPTLYLLDKDKRVILKDAPVEYVEHGFMNEQ